MSLQVGDRVETRNGRRGAVKSIHNGDALVAWDDGFTGKCYVNGLTVVPDDEPEEEEPEPIRVGDRVRHNGKVSSDFRRLGGRVESVNVHKGGRVAIVLWDGLGCYREELLSQLEVVHRAKTETDDAPKTGQAIDLLDAEYKATVAKIKELQDYRDAIGTAMTVLAEAIA